MRKSVISAAGRIPAATSTRPLLAKLKRNPHSMSVSEIGIVVIGRNEGERLKRCLTSLPRPCPTVYVDSGSSDGSVAFAHSVGISVVELDTGQGFTAARARNAGWRHLLQRWPDLQFVQFVDGDCEIDERWLPHAIDAIESDPTLAAVFGRRRERFPERSIYNRQCDDEWDGPVGRALHCGGDAFFRVGALVEAGGYSDDLIAGEEPDLCLRLGQHGWWVQRIDAEMTLHDANILTFSAWWKRAKRSGYAYAEHVWRHGSRAFPQWRRQVLSILFWGMILPGGALLLTMLLLLVAEGVSFMPLAALMLTFILQGARIAIRMIKQGQPPKDAIQITALVLVGKFAEVRGIAECVLSHLRSQEIKIMEYK